MTIGLRRRILAPAVLDLLVLGQRVGDQREQPDILPEDLGQRLRRLAPRGGILVGQLVQRSEEHTSELQSLMRISYAVFCLKKKNITHSTTHNIQIYQIL